MNAPRKGYTGYTQAMGRASQKYVKEKTDPMTIRFPKGFKATVMSHLELTGESIVGFFRRAVEETIARDRARMREGFKPEKITEDE